MKGKTLVLLGMFLSGLLLSHGRAQAEANWPTWRGPSTDGMAEEGNPPTEWSESKNIRWKARITGLGHATPIVWGDRIFVQTAAKLDDGEQLQFKVLAIDRKTGKTLWTKVARQGAPHEGMHQTGSYASPSGVTDGKHFYAFFGSQGLYCYDLDGNLKWEKDLGDMKIRNAFGEGTSPALHGDKLIVKWDHEGASFITALDKRTGKELWRNERDEITSWSTPLVVPHKGRNQVVVSATKRTRSYDLETGKLIWECGGLGTNPIPMPVQANGIVYVMSGHRRPALQAIRLDAASGDITGTDAILWSLDRDTPYVSSPLLHEGKLYFLKNRKGVLSCYDAATGKAFYGPERLEGIQNAYASLAGVGNRVYISGLSGGTVVVKHGPEFKVLATNTLDEGIAASPVLIGDTLLLRGERHLYCIAEK